jgi:predicted permease
MENEGMRITVVGALAIVGVVLLIALLARFLRNESPRDGSSSQA